MKFIKFVFLFMAMPRCGYRQEILQSVRGAHCDRRQAAAFCPSSAGGGIWVPAIRPAADFNRIGVLFCAAGGVGNWADFLFLFCAAAAYALGFGGFCKPLAWMRGGFGSNEDGK